MKNLILIRHAKSSWDAPLKDIDRPLDKRGMKDAHLVSLKVLDFIPKTFVIWSSSAKRTVDTALIFAQNFSYPLDSIIYKDDLYTFDEIVLENFIKSCGDTFESLILFCHNGAITDFVNKFGDQMIQNVPTAGFVHLNFDTNQWRTIKKGKILKTVFPKNLK